MILSMTGFGKATGEHAGTKISVEIKTLNSKTNDTKLRLPNSYREKELEVRNLISEHLQRGKIELGLFLESAGNVNAAKINLELAQTYMAQINELSTLTDTNSDNVLDVLLKMPNVLENEQQEFDEEEWKSILQVLTQSLEAVNEFRADEGKQLELDLLKRVENIESRLGKVIELAPERSMAKREKLLARLEEMAAEKDAIDENRFEQELIYYLEKFDITEEQVRLKAHIDYFRRTAELKPGQGKKLGFITQEMGREINTIGSKANHAGMQQYVVEMKDELEKVKEQVLNVL